MKAKAFTEAWDNQVAFIAHDIKEVINAHECGLVIWDESAWFSSTSGFNEHYEGDSDETSLDDIADVISTANDLLAKGEKIYCGSWLEGYTTTENYATSLDCDFHLGQTVFFLVENKIQSGTIRGIQLSKTSADFKSIKDGAFRAYEKNGHCMPYFEAERLRDGGDFQSKVHIHTDKWMTFRRFNDNHNVDCIELPVSQVFATKQELVESLMSED